MEFWGSFWSFENVRHFIYSDFKSHRDLSDNVLWLKAHSTKIYKYNNNDILLESLSKLLFS